ncbi:MAG: hypothetical protein LBG76_09540 [Treponema sp.]|jgi:hypothetical protein|nr:hypothetical protein [Treponema sp.]
MKDKVQVVDLNDFELKGAYVMAEHIKRLGKGYKWEQRLNENSLMRYVVEEASGSRVVVSGIFAEPRFRFVVKDDKVYFTTVNSVWPEFLFYDFARCLACAVEGMEKILIPSIDAVDAFSTDINDYYLVNNDYTKRIAGSFNRLIEKGEELKYCSGMFSIWMGTASFGDAKVVRLVKGFAESSFFDQVALAAVFCRGRGIPVFFAEGGVYYPLEEKEFCESIQENFSRIFMKASGKYPHKVIDLSTLEKK